MHHYDRVIGNHGHAIGESRLFFAGSHRWRRIDPRNTSLLLYLIGVSTAHTAIGTSAVAVAVNVYVNLISHARARNVRWRNAIVFTFVGAIGALAELPLGKAIDGDRLLFFFGLLMLGCRRADVQKPKRDQSP